MQLNKNVPAVVVQFQFTKRSSVPAWIPTVPPPETDREKEKRLNRQGSGRLVLGPQENSSVFKILEGLMANGYAIVNVKHEERRNDNRPGTFQVVQATFWRADENFTPMDEFLKEVQSEAFEKACEGIVQLCVCNFWRVRVYDNPFFRRGEPVEGLHCATICCDVKKPTVQGNGEPVLVWQKARIDIEGPPTRWQAQDGYPSRPVRVGTAPQPLISSHTLLMNNDTIVIVLE